MVQRTVTLTRGNTITQDDLPDEIRHFQAVTRGGTLGERLEAVEREMILSALDKSGWVPDTGSPSFGHQRTGTQI